MENNSNNQGNNNNFQNGNQYSQPNQQYGPNYSGNNPNYQPYGYNQPYGPGYPRESDKPVSIGNWILTFIVMAIPLVNIIMLFVWGFSSDVNESKRNFCKAELILMGIGFVLTIIIIIIVAMAAASSGPSYSY